MTHLNKTRTEDNKPSDYATTFPSLLKKDINLFQNHRATCIWLKLVGKICGDMIIWWENQQEHDKNMKNVLQRRGPKLNPKKRIFSADHVVFAGHVLLSN